MKTFIKKYFFLISTIILTFIWITTHYNFLFQAFIWDDLPYMFDYKSINNFKEFIFYVLSPRGEHFVFVTRIIYFVYFYLFGFSVYPFHITTLIVFIIFLYLFLSLIYKLTKNYYISFFCVSLLATTHIYDEIFYWINTTFFLFSCLFFFIALYILISNRNNIFKKIIFIVSISLLYISITTYALMFTPWLIIACFLNRSKGDRKFYLITILINCFCILCLYFTKGPMLNSSAINSQNSVDYYLIFELILSSIFYKLLPKLYFSIKYPYSFYINLLIIPYICLLLSKSKKFIDKKYFLFFSSLLLLSLLAPFYARFNEGFKIINWGRYYIYPFSFFVIIISILFNAINQKFEFKTKFSLIFISIIIVINCYISFLYKTPILHNFKNQKNIELEVNEAFFKYLSKNNEKAQISIKTKDIQTIYYSEPWPNKNYLKIFLSQDLFNKINFSDKTSTEFKKFLIQNNYHNTLYLVK